MSTEPKEPIDDIVVSEEKDGSVVVDLPESIPSPDEQEEVRAAEGGSVDDGDADHPDDTDAIRAARRNRRKAKREYMKQTSIEKDARLQNLQRQNQELLERLSAVERRQSGADLARLDKAIEDKELRLQYAKMKLSEAVQAGDGDAMVEAQTMWNEAQSAVGEFARAKQHAEREAQTRNDTPVVDPTVQRNAADWMRRNSWYRPDTSDRDSQIAKKVDELLVTEGMNPSDPDYWDELDSRLQKSLPHRYNQSSDDNPVVRKPRNVVGSSGREASAAFGGNNRSQFMLSPERVKAMKEIGAWDNPERKKKMIAEFVKFDRLNRN